MTTDAVVPPWLHDIFLGYGNPDSATFYTMPERILDTLDFKDTFLDVEHLREAFQDCQLVLHDEDGELRPPFRLVFPKAGTEEGPQCLQEVHAHPYPAPPRGPYPEDAPRHNPVRYTSSQGGWCSLTLEFAVTPPYSLHSRLQPDIFCSSPL